MKLKKLPNMPEPFGVQILDIPQLVSMSSEEWKEIGKICMKYLVVVLMTIDFSRITDYSPEKVIMYG